MYHIKRADKNITKTHADLKTIEKYRTDLFRNQMPFNMSLPGAGSRAKRNVKTFGDTARLMSVNRKYGEFLYRLVKYYQPDLVIELGSAFGISTMYLALADPAVQVITIEGNSGIAEKTTRCFAEYKVNNVSLINKSFDDVLEDLKQKITAKSMVFIDGNHAGDATIKYFETFSESGVLIFDDIRWSEEMAIAWNRIKQVSSGITIDLFKMGIVFNINFKNQF